MIGSTFHGCRTNSSVKIGHFMNGGTQIRRRWKHICTVISVLALVIVCSCGNSTGITIDDGTIDEQIQPQNDSPSTQNGLQSREDLPNDKTTSEQEVRPSSVPPINLPPVGSPLDPPLTVRNGDYSSKWIGGSCKSASSDCQFTNSHCLREEDGFPDGSCTKSCNNSCPSGNGSRYDEAVCVDASSFTTIDSSLCFPQCDHDAFPETGCRNGYSCRERHHNDKETTVSICLPEGIIEDEPVDTGGGNDGLDDDVPPYADGDYSSFDWPNQGAEAWRPLLEMYFQSKDITWAIKVINCESGGNPSAYNNGSGASGLFQHMPQYWEGRAKAAGFEGADIFDAEANIAASSYLYYNGGPGHWSCKG